MCACHDAHNVLKWLMFVELNDASMMNALYISIIGIRRVYDMVIRNVLPRTSSRVLFVPRHELDPDQERQELWTTLGVSPDLAFVFVEIGLQWCEATGRITVDGRIQSEECC